MSIVRLRTLTRKSVIGFGEFVDINVQQVFDMCREYNLLQLYYGCGNISFSEDILQELGIVGEYKIEKPGSLRPGDTKVKCFIDGQEITSSLTAAGCMMSKYIKKQQEAGTEQKRLNVLSREKASKRQDITIGSYRRSLANYSKGAMQYKGQHHKPF